MSYLSKILPVIAVLMALGGAIYYVLSEQPKPAAALPTQQHATTARQSLIPPSYAHKPS